MKLYSFLDGGQVKIGAELREQIIDLPAAYEAMRATRKLPASSFPALPSDMLSFLRMGDAALNAAREALAFTQKRPALPVGVQVTHLLETVKLVAPLPRPGKILCSGINYKGHLEENPGAKMPTE